MCFSRIAIAAASNSDRALPPRGTHPSVFFFSLSVTVHPFSEEDPASQGHGTPNIPRAKILRDFLPQVSVLKGLVHSTIPASGSTEGILFIFPHTSKEVPSEPGLQSVWMYVVHSRTSPAEAKAGLGWGRGMSTEGVEVAYGDGVFLKHALYMVHAQQPWHFCQF